MDAPEGGEKPEKPSPTPLDAERAKLRAAGYTDHEISQILIAKAAAAPHATSGGLGVMSGALNNFTAALATARGAIPNMLTDVETVFGAGVARGARIKAFVAFTFKAVLIGAIGFAVYQEWRQHIISETEIAAINVRKLHAEECDARLKVLNFGTIQENEWLKDCSAPRMKIGEEATQAAQTENKLARARKRLKAAYPEVPDAEIEKRAKKACVTANGEAACQE